MIATRLAVGRLCFAAAVVSGVLVSTSAWWLLIAVPSGIAWLYLLLTARRTLRHRLGEEALQAAREWDAAHPEEAAARAEAGADATADLSPEDGRSVDPRH